MSDFDQRKDKAFIGLIFEVDGEVLRPVEGGLETPSGNKAAWKLVMR